MQHEKFPVNKGLVYFWSWTKGVWYLLTPFLKMYYFVKLIVDFQVSFKYY